ncbi:surface proteins containing Ig-like domains-like [Fimbriiglobus ruber]|uniref:Surface proteins containing Ig-like domains-like n=2 Tax=Fimbriiglobus ruber TaxID=1908690 RepID=A0A225DJV6_9BACT|nr:surface proteins containing Ig-like domains-like [Fimbriiglobus ruber]
MVYGGTVPNLGYTATGYVNEDSSSVLSGSLSTGATATSGVGSYSITQGTLDAGSNYAIAFTPGTLTVTPATLEIIASGQTVVYGSTIPDLAYSSSGLVNGDTISGSLSTSATSASGVGTYPITQGNLDAGPNYTVTYTAATLAIDPAPLSVAANDQKMVLGSPVPALTFTATGFVNGDTLASLGGSLSADASTVGTHAITLGDLSEPNYTITFTPGTLTVYAKLTATVSPALVAGLPNQIFTLTASGAGGDGNYTYTWDDTSTTASDDVSYPAAGDYTVGVTVTDGFGQSARATASVHVTADPNLAVTIGPAAGYTWVNHGFLFTATATGGDGSYTYVWGMERAGRRIRCRTRRPAIIRSA